MAQVNEYIADGIRTVFTYNFPAFDLADLGVTVNGQAQVGTYQVYGLGGGNGGAVEFAAAPAAGSVVRIARVRVPGQVAYLVKDENLADVADVGEARTNLGVYSTTQTDAAITGAVSAVSNAALMKAANLADVADVGEARTNLGVYSTTQTDAAITGAVSVVSGAALMKAENLGDVADVGEARANLGVYSTTQTDAAITGAVSAVSEAALMKAANLADVADVGEARANLGVYSTTQTDAAITGAVSAVSGAALMKAENLGDVADVGEARANLGVYSTTQIDAAISGAVSAVSGAALMKAENLADVPDKPLARTNLGLATVAATGAYADLSGKPTLGTAAALNVGTGPNQVVQMTAQGKYPAGDGSLLTNINAGTGAGGYRNLQVFTASGTFVVPAGVTEVFVELWGGGGGGRVANGNYPAGGEGGGGGGGYASKRIAGLTPGSSIAVTVGAGGGSNTNGGSSSFGSHCSASGGCTAPIEVNARRAGGAGGSGANGNLNLSGAPGGEGHCAYLEGLTFALAGRGGDSPLGGSGGSPRFTMSSTLSFDSVQGVPGTVPGGGGSGALGGGVYAGFGARGEVRVYW